MDLPVPCPGEAELAQKKTRFRGLRYFVDLVFSSSSIEDDEHGQSFHAAV